MSSSKLTHLDEHGNAQMVDVGAKPESLRIAIAGGEIIMKADTLKLIKEGQIKKGDVLTVAKVAGISGAKRTSEMIPFCHPIALDHLEINFEFDDQLPGIQIRSTARIVGKTGVEMEALTAVSVAALTIYDMAKAVDKTMAIQNIRLIEKRGGRSGDVVNE
jgi:cyclic pyranopterin phosphate synthase